jgi:tetratricopeptide (TPR) repeat protein
MMTRGTIVVAVVAAALAGTPARADDAPGAANRSPADYARDLRQVAASLLDQLRDAKEAAAARALEQRIWDTWMRSGDAEVDRMMRQGTTEMRFGRLNQALAAFDAAIARKPDYAEAWNKRATLHYMAGNLAASLADIGKVLVLEPRHFGALSGIGLIHIAQGDKAAALAAYRRVLAVFPLNEGAKQAVDGLAQDVEGDPI